MHKKRKTNRIILMSLFLLFISLTQVFAWNSNREHKTNNFTKQNFEGIVVLQKLSSSDDSNAEITALENAVFELYHKDTDEKINDTYTTDAFGEIKVEGLGVGEYYFLEVKPPKGYTFVQDENGKDIKKYPFEITEEKKQVFVSAKNRLIEQSLTVNKTLVNKNGSQLTESQKLTAFNFVVTFGEDATYKYKINDSDTVFDYENGDIIHLKHEDTITFINLNEGLHYEVVEEAMDHYTIEATNNKGKISGKTSVTFKNIYEEAHGNINITKHIVNEDASELTPEQKAMFFEFFVTLSDQSSFKYKINDGIVLNAQSGSGLPLKHGDTLSILDLKENQRFHIEERDYSNQFYFSNKRVIEGIVTNENKSYTVINTYSNSSAINQVGALHISKRVLNTQSNDSFTFRVHLDNDTDVSYRISNGAWKPYASPQNITMLSSDVIQFKDIPLWSKFKVEELNDDQYISHVKEYEGTITSQDEPLSLEFVNELINRQENITMTIKKTVLNTVSDQSFDFELFLDDQKKTFNLKDNETISFEVEKGVDYKLIEKDYSDSGFVQTIENQSGITGDEDIMINVTNSYHKDMELIEIKGVKTWDQNDDDNLLPEFIEIELYGDDEIVDLIKVQEDGNGEWKYSVKVPKYSADGREIVYNIKEVELDGYTVEYDSFNLKNTKINPVSFTPKVKKEVVGKPKKDKEFLFNIQAVNLAPIQDITSARILGNGFADFSSIEFSKEGVYTYIISEQLDQDTEYTYDVTPVYLKINVLRNKGDLKIQSFTYSKDGYESNEEYAYFKNKYHSTAKPPKKEGQNDSDDSPKTGINEHTVFYLNIILLLSLILLRLSKIKFLKKD